VQHCRHAFPQICNATGTLQIRSHTLSLTHTHTHAHAHAQTHIDAHTHTPQWNTNTNNYTHMWAPTCISTHIFPFFQAHIYLDGYSRCDKRGGLSGNVRPKKIHCTPLCTTRQKCMRIYKKSHTSTNIRPFSFSLSLAVLFFLSLSLLSSLPLSFPCFGSRDLCQSICSFLST